MFKAKKKKNMTVLIDYQVKTYTVNVTYKAVGEYFMEISLR